MTATTSTGLPSSRSAAHRLLGATGVFWYLVAVVGQWLFVAYIAAFYGGAAMQGDLARWNDVLVGGYVAGGTVGNIVLAAHLLLAVVITVGGPLQLIPAIRARALPIHRWNGRLYLTTAVVISLAGLWMVWTRGTAGGPIMRIGISLNGVLILVCAALTLRFALARRIDIHRRWAMRTFVLVSGVWFFRVGLMLWILANQGPVGVGDDFDGPFVRFWAFGCYLVPLVVLELYQRARDGRGAAGKLAMAGALFVMTLATGLGIFGALIGLWLPHMTG